MAEPSLTALACLASSEICCAHSVKHVPVFVKMAELTEVQKLYKDLRKFVRRDNYTKAVNVCTQLRKKLPDDIEPLQCHCVCLLKGDKFQQSFDVATKAANGAPGSERDPASFLLLERAYCLYRLNKLSAALKLLAGAANKSKRPELMHLEAQIRYRQGDYDSAIEGNNLKRKVHEAQSAAGEGNQTLIEAQKKVDLNDSIIELVFEQKNKLIRSIHSCKPLEVKIAPKPTSKPPPKRKKKLPDAYMED